MRRLLLALPLLFAPASCIAIAGAGAGILIHQELYPSYIQSHVGADVEEVWATAKAVLAEESEGPIEVVQEFPREVKGDLDGTEVRVRVEAYDLDQTIVRVYARRFGVYDQYKAEAFTNMILDRIQAHRF